MDRGYIKLWRKTIDSGMLKNHELWAFWCWCLMKASHKKTKVMVGYKEVELNQGDFVFGRRNAASELNLSEQTIRTCLNLLKSTSKLTIKSTNKFSIISIIKWDIYQSQNFEINQQTNQLPNKPVTSSQPASNQQVTTNKNLRIKEFKNVKNSKEIKEGVYTPDFETFWQAYPKKTGKLAAWDAWRKKNGTRPDVDILIQKITEFKLSPQWLESGGKYIPNPTTWINQGRWDDEIPQVKHYDKKAIHNLMVTKQFLEDMQNEHQ